MATSRAWALFMVLLFLSLNLLVLYKMATVWWKVIFA
jgi:hypothetical protein